MVPGVGLLFCEVVKGETTHEFYMEFGGELRPQTL